MDGILLPKRNEHVHSSNTNGSSLQRTINVRRLPHFVFNRRTGLQAQDLIGKTRAPDDKSGRFPQSVLSAIVELENASATDIFDIWCEATIESHNGGGRSIVRCWPQYGGEKGEWYDWVRVHFETDQGDCDSSSPAKVLAIYAASNTERGDLKAIVHSVDYKTTRAIESSTGDSRLVTHYRLQFNSSSGNPQLYSVPLKDIKEHLLVYTAKKYKGPIPPKVRSPSQQKEHTVMTIMPRKQWATLFITWI